MSKKKKDDFDFWKPFETAPSAEQGLDTGREAGEGPAGADTPDAPADQADAAWRESASGHTEAAWSGGPESHPGPPPVTPPTAETDAAAPPAAARRTGAGRGWLATRARHLTLAATFLTGLPLRAPEPTAEDLWASMGWYPIVGLGLGVAGWAVYAVGASILPNAVAAALAVIALELFTRALHLDGLMDTCDGYFSGAPRERALEIMKDSRVGAMGVFGAIAVVLLKVTALASLSRTGAGLPLLVGWTAARTLAPIDVRVFPYVRPQGTGEAFGRGTGDNPVIAAPATLMIVAAAVGGVTGRLPAVLLVASASLLVAFLAQLAVARRLGGLTGDVYGCGIELVEVAALVVAAAIAA